jgi:hypothetical protein
MPEFITTEAHNNMCEKLWETYEKRHNELTLGLSEVKAAIQHRNNIDADKVGYDRGVTETRDAQIRSIQLWGKILIAVVIILNGIGFFSLIKNREVSNENGIEIEKVLEGLSKLTKE